MGSRWECALSGVDQGLRGNTLLAIASFNGIFFVKKRGGVVLLVGQNANPWVFFFFFWWAPNSGHGSPPNEKTHIYSLARGEKRR